MVRRNLLVVVLAAAVCGAGAVPALAAGKGKAAPSKPAAGTAPAAKAAPAKEAPAKEAPLQGLQGKEVQYTTGRTTFKGYLAWDASLPGRRPGVLVVHEWWGHNEYARRRARMLAELGYVALALDMYGDGKTAAHPDDAGKFAAEVMQNIDVMKSRFLAGMEFLQGQPQTDPRRIAAIGYCMGGAVALNMARAGLSLKGVASFHGSLGSGVKAQRGMVQAKLLVMNGADDTFITKEQVAAFKQEMADAGADLRFIDYPGAKHSFTNPQADEFAKKFGLNLAYNAEADRLSWEELKGFLATVLK